MAGVNIVTNDTEIYMVYRRDERIEHVIGQHVKIILCNAFEGCTGLKSIIAPDNVVISDHAFNGCLALENIEMYKLKTIGSMAFNGCWKLRSVIAPNVNTILPYSFAGCANLVSIKLHNITNVPNFAFSGCIKLKFIEITNVVSLYQGAFTGCSSLRYVILPEVRDVDASAFDNSGVRFVIAPKLNAMIGYVKNITFLSNDHINTHKNTYENRCILYKLLYWNINNHNSYRTKHIIINWLRVVEALKYRFNYTIPVEIAIIIAEHIPL